MNKKYIPFGMFVGMFGLVLFSCTPESTLLSPQQGSSIQEVKSQAQAETKKGLYDLEIKPLTLEDCAKCHFSIFKTIKDRGGKHQKECTFCHQQFHAYSPKKQNWEELMPKCQNCHGLKHGEAYPNCFSCHSNPHAPKQEIKVTEAFAKECVKCHSQINQEITTHKSKHTELGCAFCHTEKHGNKPVCQDCHSPHTPQQTYKDCLTCHKPHSPKNLPDFAADTPNAVCGSCHTKPFEKLSKSIAKHKDLTCSTCHTRHKFIPQCQTCHGEPHNPELHKRVPKCLDCHLDVHNLPVKK